MSTRNVMIVEGSPRMNGNSAILAKQLAAGAKEAGIRIEALSFFC